MIPHDKNSSKWSLSSSTMLAGILLCLILNGVSYIKYIWAMLPEGFHFIRSILLTTAGV